MSQVINGQTYNKFGVGTPNGDRYARFVLSASVSGSPAAGTAFSALTVSASITLPDLGINTPISVTGFTRSNGTVVEGTNTMTVTWKGISKTITFTGVSGGGTGTITLNHSTLSIAEDGTSTLTATLTGSLIGQPITWSAGNANVTISGSGATVTLTAAGDADSTCVITASCGGQTATCTVTITAAGGGDPSDTPVPGEEAVALIHKYETFTEGETAEDSVGELDLTYSAVNTNQMFGVGGDDRNIFGYPEFTVVAKIKINQYNTTQAKISFARNGVSSHTYSGCVLSLGATSANGAVIGPCGASVGFALGQTQYDRVDTISTETYTAEGDTYMTVAIEVDMRDSVSRYALWRVSDDGSTTINKAAGVVVPDLAAQGLFIVKPIDPPAFVEVYKGLKYSKDTGIEVS